MEINFKKKEDAKRVLDRANELISRFGFVAVTDLRGMVGLSNPGESRTQGWTSLDDARIVGATLKLPDPQVAG